MFSVFDNNGPRDPSIVLDYDQLNLLFKTALLEEPTELVTEVDDPSHSTDFIIKFTTKMDSSGKK